MGLICSCLSADDFDEYTSSDGSIYRQCFCLRCFTQPMINAYTSIFRRGEVRAAPSSVQETTPLASATLVDGNSLSYSYRSPPRPLPYDDPRCSRIERDGSVSRRDKSSSHLHEESETLTAVTDADIESNGRAEKLCGSKLGGRSKLCYTESSLKHPLEEVSSGVACLFPSSEDEDVCPTCLDEYTSENPRIVMQCSHHFHLSCIYEWMERSEACPVCGKVMVFNETA